MNESLKTPRLAPVVLLSLLSGVAWIGIATLIGRPMSHILRGGVIVAPLIALLAGFASAWFPAKGILRRALFSLVSLYLAAALFGLAMGVYDWQTGQNVGDGWRRVRSAVILQAMTATLWGLTFFGYFLLLWPLAYANHALLARVWNRGRAI